MASGDAVVEIISITPPATLYATPNAIAGAATPNESVPCWDFDQTTAEYLDFLCRLNESYAGGGLTFQIGWAGLAATNNVRWGIGIRALPDDAEDIDNTAHSYDYNDVSPDAPAPSGVGEVVYDTITFSNGVDMDSWAVGELAIVRVRRTAATSNMAADARLISLAGKET